MDFKPEIPEKLKVKPAAPQQQTTTASDVANENADAHFSVIAEAEVKKPIPPKTVTLPYVEPAASAQPKQNSAVTIDDRGTFKAMTIEARYRIAQYAIASRMVPKSYSTPEQVMIGMEYAYELGLQPLTGLRSIAIINGTPSIFGELPMALVRRSDLIDWYDEKIYDKDLKEICLENKNLTAEPWVGWGKYKRKGGSTVERFFTMDDAKRAGLLNKDGPWRTYPRRMLQMRARSHALKDLFPDVLLGISVSEYDHNLAPDIGGIVRDVNETTGEKTEAARLKDALSKS